MSPLAGDGRGTSPTIGVILVVAITVVLAALIGAAVMGFESELVDVTHPVSFETEWVADGGANNGNGAYLTITYTAGNALSQEQVLVRDDDGNQVRWDDVWTADSTDRVEPGDFVHIDGHGSDSALSPPCDVGQRYIIVVEHDDGSTTVVTEFVVSTPATDRANC